MLPIDTWALPPTDCQWRPWSCDSPKRLEYSIVTLTRSLLRGLKDDLEMGMMQQSLEMCYVAVLLQPCIAKYHERPYSMSGWCFWTYCLQSHLRGLPFLYCHLVDLAEPKFVRGDTYRCDVAFDGCSFIVYVSIPLAIHQSGEHPAKRSVCPLWEGHAVAHHNILAQRCV